VAQNYRDAVDQLRKETFKNKAAECRIEGGKLS
jgi:hypothetical protein